MFTPNPAASALRFVVQLVLGALLVGITPVAASPAALGGIATTDLGEASGPKDEMSLASIGARRIARQAEIAATRTELAKLPAGVSSDTARWLTQEIALLERIDAIHAEQERTWQHAADLALEAAGLQERLRNRRPAETTLQPPYDLPLLDQLYGERDDLDRLAIVLKRDIENTETLVQEARDFLDEKDRERRAVRGRENVGKLDDEKRDNLRLAELESRLGEETLLLREKALKTLRLQRSLLEPKQQLLRPRLEWLRSRVTVGAEPLGVTQPQRLLEVDAAIAAAKQDLDQVTQSVIALERRATHEQIAPELELGRANRQTANLTLSVLIAQRERLAEKANVTALRRDVLAARLSRSALRALARENGTMIDQLVGENQRARRELYRSRREFQDWQSSIAQTAALDEKPALWIVERVKRLPPWIDLSQKEVSDLDGLRIERSRLQEEIGTRVTLISWRDAMTASREGALAAWNFEIFSVQDQPVRVKTVLTVLVLVLLGYHVSRWISEQVSRRVFRRLGMNTGRAAAWQSLWFYALFVVVLVVAFNLFHISLTQFSVVSGALAVGIGFGSQNLISNFISGIILLIERPVNQGDVIEIDGHRVTVERLGARSTIVRTLENTHMVVPNSRLLEQPVINWTLSDEVVRQQIRVGVAYGSPTRKVAALLQGILESVESVKKEPKPLVKFADFAESSLVFDVYFWASIEERLETENELRHRMTEVFNAEAIAMAFPQRDVHLQTTEPLQVIIAPPVAIEADANSGQPINSEPKPGETAAVPPVRIS